MCVCVRIVQFNGDLTEFESPLNSTIYGLNCHTLSTLIDLYDYPHIFYVKNNPHLLPLDTDWIF